MKQVTVVGVGTGWDTLTVEGLRAIEDAELLFGAKRLLDTVARLAKPSICCYRAEEIKENIMASAYTRFAVLVSGDVGFYSAARALRQCQQELALCFLPGVCSVSSFCAKLQTDWQDAALISMHKTPSNLADTVRRNKKTLCLAGESVSALARQLIEAGLGGCAVAVGSNLGSQEERILHTTAEELASNGVDTLSLLLIVNPAANKRVHIGIGDEAFCRGEAPMTKAEVRAVSVSKMCLSPEDICIDAGCGTGSVTVEMALCCHEGRVYAIDRDPRAIALTQENCARFRVGNVTTLLGRAEQIIPTLPPPDVLFVGGSGGSMNEIVSAAVKRNPRVRIVVNAIAPESVCQALDAMERCNVADIEGVQISCARLKAAGRLHLMHAQNPVTVLWGGGTNG